MGMFKKLARGVKRGVKKAAKSTVSTFNPFDDKFDLEKTALAIGTGGGSLFLEQAAEIGGSALSGAIEGLSKPEEEADLGALDVSGDVDDAADKRKRLLEAQRRNAPGLRQQSVLNPIV